VAFGLTFTTLKSTLQAYLERGTSVDPTVYESLPQLINTAERSIARRFKVQGYLSNVVSALQPNLGVYAKPDRWRRTVSMSYGSGTASPWTADASITADSSITVDGSIQTVQNFRNFIYPRSLEYCQRYWPDQSQTGAPKFYADYSYGFWLIVPTPDIAYPWAVNYYQQPPLLDTTNQTNWLTDFCPNLLLYRALLECTPYLKNDERIPVWKDFYTDELNAVNEEDLQKAADRTYKRNES
jgi:hypothetical protein